MSAVIVIDPMGNITITPNGVSPHLLILACDKAKQTIQTHLAIEASKAGANSAQQRERYFALISSQNPYLN